MKRIIPIPVLLVLLIMSPAARGEVSQKSSAEQSFYLSGGDPISGRGAFQSMQCFACHRVEGDTGFPLPTSSIPGPMIRAKISEFHLCDLADSIVSPSHRIVSGSQGLSEDLTLSRMGDFTESMTVRNLIDLVAYFKTLNPADEADAGAI